MGNWKDSQQGDTQTVEIHLTGGVVIALGLMLLVAMVLGYLVWSEREVAAAGVQSISAQAGTPPKYYLTTALVDGDEPLTACATGYHMASLWEIIDPSNLQYNTTLGGTRDDSGSGPPANYSGWVRTGYSGDTSATPGEGNCQAWTIASAGGNGTIVRLPTDWTAAATQSAFWEALVYPCSATVPVWCVED